VLVADASQRMHAGRSGMYDVRVRTADGELVAEFRGHTRTIRGKAEE
jgi:acyl-CoA thioesterase